MNMLVLHINRELFLLAWLTSCISLKGLIRDLKKPLTVCIPTNICMRNLVPSGTSEQPWDLEWRVGVQGSDSPVWVPWLSGLPQLLR